MYTLLPHTINLTLLPDEVLGMLGRVNEVTEPAKRLLEELGFRFCQRVDPFDAGPHMEADRDDVSAVRESAAYEFGEAFDPGAEQQFDPTLPAGDFVPLSTAGHRCLISTHRDGVGFRAVNARFLVGEGGRLRISSDAAEALSLEAGEPIWLTPYELPPERHGDEPVPTITVSPSGPVRPAQIEDELKRLSGRPAAGAHAGHGGDGGDA
jgi:arginine/ornithine N-succinyltransferase beta subunit